MQQGTCFINYEDFKECYRTYKKETKSIYSIQNSTSVEYYNSRCGANIREDIIFTQVKFCCSKLQGHNGKRKTQENICPAYFLLQYDIKLDRLVVKEECTTHIHSEKEKFSLTLPPVKTVSIDFDVPSKKICEERPSLSPVKEDDQGKIFQDAPCNSNTDLTLDVQDIAESPSNDKPSASINTIPPEIPVEAVARLANLIIDFQTRDVGSKSSLIINCQQQLDQLCFQTGKMGSLFEKFPESILIHKVACKHGYILYSFLVENKERIGKVVNFSFIKEDNARNISNLFEMFKDYSPEWAKVKVIYIDISFGHVDILKKAFPSAQTLLSVYHTVRLIERKSKGSSNFKDWLRKWIDDAIYHTTPEKLNFLSEKLQHKLDKDLYAKLSANWFSCELLWYMHVKKGLHACNTYMDSLGLVTDTISSLLAKQSSMETTIQQFIESADCFNSKGLENQRDGSLGFSRRTPKVPRKNNKEKPQHILPLPLPVPQIGHLKPLKVKSTWKPCPSSESSTLSLDKPGNALIFNRKVPSRPREKSNTMLFSLREHCNDLGFQLCLKEWEVVQKSTHLINVKTNFIAVQILEESHAVSFNGQSCTCYFNQLYKLPCRHILSMLYANKKPVKEDMVCLSWLKRYKQPISDAKVSNTILYYSKSEEEAKERVTKIKSLAKELCNLLMQCDGAEIQVRSSTLQLLMDRWRNESNHIKDELVQNEPNELPYQWVKKEPLDGADNSGCYELCRLDTYPAIK
ncbi:zinc finger SWIM domain-containing protein 3 [Pseudophryne corroboree]|uniref:zinc finger SWIM domain-containing protein 3 n=1 Tax=Pseudophryne corroboree TaxID=495146 RepID=UPI0030818D5B